MTIDFSELFSVLFAFRFELLLVALLIVGVILIALRIVGVILILRGSSDSKPHTVVDDHTTKFIQLLKNGKVVEEWYDVPVHYFKTTNHASHNNPSDLAQFVADLANKTNITGLVNAASNAAVKYVRLPFLRCKDPSFLFGDEFPLLLIRSQYVSLCNEILGQSETQRATFVVDGNSGVGKSMFIYYFMYRLHKKSVSNPASNPTSFQVTNLGCQESNDPSAAPSVASSDTCTGYDWGIFDSTARFGNTPFKSILLVTSNPIALRDPQTYTKRGRLGMTLYLSMSAWSYAETCAVGLSPCKILQTTLNVDAASSKTNSHGPSQPVPRGGFSVLHPLFICLQFISLRSTPRELRSRHFISYTTSASDGRTNPITDPDPEFMFFKRSEGVFPDMLDVPYVVFESVFDRSFDDIKSSLWISSKKMHFEGITSFCELHDPYDYGVNDDRTDASQLTSLVGLELRYQAAIPDDDHKHMVQAAYLSIAMDLARSMHTNTDNAQFRDVLTAIFPFLCTAISFGLSGLCTYVIGASSSKFDSQEEKFKQSSTGALTFRMHPNVIHTEPPDSRIYGARMPRSLSIYTTNILLDVFADALFLYYFRSNTIASMVLEHTVRWTKTSRSPRGSSAV